jgi:trimeric autotransporter adhesin
MADKDFKVKAGLDLGSPLSIAEGGTGQTTATNTLNALLPVQTSASGQILQSDGTNVSWVDKPNGYTKGNTDSRPASPSVGDIYSNTQTGYIEVYTSGGWSQLGVIPLSATIGTASNVANTPYGSARVDVAFTPNTGGGLASSFTAISNPGSITGTGASSPVRVTGLTQGTAYTFTITASNGYGNALASSPSNSATPTAVPQAPTIGTATADNAQASVTFTAGATGGSSITGYTITSSPGNITATGSSSPITITGLTNNTAYTFTVTATNANGTSAASSASNQVTPLNAFAVDYLVVAGGGGGGSGGNISDSRSGGGGGAGGLRSTVTATGGGGTLETALLIAPSTNYTLTVGAGGSGAGGSSVGNAGTAGSNSIFSTITSTGGGFGGRGGSSSQNGGVGGSGGGAGALPGASTGGAGTVNQGFAGGNGRSNAGGGGGGAGVAGQNAPNNELAGYGGNGVAVSISGSSVTYAGGGAGGGSNSPSGGSGGGGSSSTNGNPGTNNLGGGGGGSGWNTGSNPYGGNGGSGIVILRYPDNRTITIGAGLTGSTAAPSGGFKVSTITSGTGNVSWI